MGAGRKTAVAGLAAAFLAATGLAATVLAATGSAAVPARTPVVFFPGYGSTILRVTVRNQRSIRGCPQSGSFEDGYPASVGTAFTQVCRDRLITPRWRHSSRLTFPERFSLPQGVRVSIPAYGQTASAPGYADFYQQLEAHGYRAGVNLVVAGYDFRLTPDLGEFLPRTERLIVRTWARNGRRPVRLVGHSNGPLYAQYLLTHVSAAWRRRYIQGFTDLAGNLPGQGSMWTYVFSGLDVPDGYTLPATKAAAMSSARLIVLSPSTWMSAADPQVFGRDEVVVKDQSTGRSYTPADTNRLLRDARLGSIIPMVDHYLGFVKFADPRHFPNVDVSAEAGSGLATQVGIALPNLRVGQVVNAPTAHYIYRRGDGDQENTTNNAVRVWRRMRCHRFRFTDDPGVSHDELTTDPGVLGRLSGDLARRPSSCS